MTLVRRGIRDNDRVVVGVSLGYKERDKIRRDVTSKLNLIEPRLNPSRYRIEMHQVYDDHRHPVADTFVVELAVPASASLDPYFTAGGEVWVRVDGAKQKLRGTAMTDFIKQRVRNSLVLADSAESKKEKAVERHHCRIGRQLSNR